MIRSLGSDILLYMNNDSLYTINDINGNRYKARRVYPRHLDTNEPIVNSDVIMVKNDIDRIILTDMVSTTTEAMIAVIFTFTCRPDEWFTTDINIKNLMRIMQHSHCNNGVIVGEFLMGNDRKINNIGFIAPLDSVVPSVGSFELPLSHIDIGDIFYTLQGVFSCVGISGGSRVLLGTTSIGTNTVTPNKNYPRTVDCDEIYKWFEINLPCVCLDTIEPYGYIAVSHIELSTIKFDSYRQVPNNRMVDIHEYYKECFTISEAKKIKDFLLDGIRFKNDIETVNIKF